MLHPSFWLLLLCMGSAHIAYSCHLQTLLAGPPATHLTPSSLPRGTSTVIAVGGTLDTWPLQVWTSDPQLIVKVLDEKGKLEVAPAETIQPGIHYLRLYDAKGTSKPLPLLIDWTPHTLEHEPNNAYFESQTISTLPRMVDGVLAKRGDVDTFAMELKQGETLIASVDAHQTLQSPVDANLQIMDEKGNLLAQNLDHHGLDPQIVFSAPADGSYLVRVFGFPSEPNSTIEYDGKETYLYRLLLTTGQHWYGSVPLAVAPRQTALVQPLAYGPSLPEPISVDVSQGMNQGQARDRWEFFHPSATGIVPLKITELAILTEQNWMGTANIGSNPPQAIQIPCCLTGRISHESEKDSYTFQAKAGFAYRLQIESRILGFPLDAVLSIFDNQGKLLIRTDDVGALADPSINWKAPADGEYQLQVEDLHHQASPQHLYRLTLEEDRPRIEPTIGASSIEGVVGKPIEVTINVGRIQDTRPYRFRLANLPPGVTSEPIQSDGTGDSSKQVKLILTGSQPMQTPIAVIAESLEVPAQPPSEAKPILVQPSIPDAGFWLSILNP